MRSGLFAVCDGREYPAALTPDQREAILLVRGTDPPDGFEEFQPALYRKVVPRSRLTSLYRVYPACTYRGARFQVTEVVEDDGGRLRLRYLGGNERVAEDLCLEYAEPGVYLATAPSTEVEDLHEVRRDLHCRPTPAMGE